MFYFLTTTSEQKNVLIVAFSNERGNNELDGTTATTMGLQKFLNIHYVADKMIRKNPEFKHLKSFKHSNSGF